MRIDQTTQEVGLLQGDLSNDQIALEVVRQFFEALIVRNYGKAGGLLEGIPADRMQQGFGHMKVLRIISIGPVAPHPKPETKGVIVLCTVEIEKNGKVSEWKLAGAAWGSASVQPAGPMDNFRRDLNSSVTNI
jgi:hypothetical protein